MLMFFTFPEVAVGWLTVIGVVVYTLMIFIFIVHLLIVETT